MKLLRVSTDDTQGFFDVALNEPLKVKPMSKIGLLSFSGEVQGDEIQIERPDAQFTLDIDTYAQRWSPRNGTYGSGNANDLLASITDRYNTLEVLPSSNFANTMGGELEVRIDSGRTVIDYRVGGKEMADDESFDFVNAFSNDAGEIDSTIPVTNTALYNKSNAIGDNAVAGQFANLQAQLGDGDIVTPVSALEDQGFLIGFSRTDLTRKLGEDLEQSDIHYAIGISAKNDGGNKRTIYIQSQSTFDDLNIEPVFNGVNDADNTQIAIVKNGSSIQFYYTNTGKDNWKKVTTIEFTVSLGVPLYPFVVFKSSYGLQAVSYTPNPFLVNVRATPEINTASILDNHFVSKPYRLRMLKDIGNFLGFSDDQLDTTRDSTGDWKLTSSSPFSAGIDEKNFILELIGNNLETYDATQKQRVNIVSSVITSTRNTLRTSGTSSVFLDLDNRDEIDLSNLKMRLCDGNFKTITTKGTLVATLLIADKEEMGGTI